jgi:uncharacterized protein YggU (UPF0235/DUF167 family)
MRLRVKPAGRANRLMGPHGGALRVEVRAAPERGRANAALIRLLAASLDIPRDRVSVTSGSASRSKTVEIEGCTAAEVADRLRALGIEATVE